MPRIFCFAMLLGLFVSTSQAQHDAMAELYGEGVHRYFSNDFSGADLLLSQVVDGGSLDPRAHYFRGLARERSGLGGEMDFEMGARLEAEARRPVDVGTALARVQGYTRTKIEIARRDARVQLKQQRMLLELARQNATPASAETVVAPDAGATPFPAELIPANDTGLTPPQPVVPEVAETADPFADDPAQTVPGASQPAVPADPFDAAATPAPPSDEADPFGAPAIETPTTPTPPSATESADPFGAPATESLDAPAADPFGAPASETPSTPLPAADPFEAPAADPFETPASEAPASEAPATDAGDPFGAPPAVGDNPFGL